MYTIQKFGQRIDGKLSEWITPGTYSECEKIRADIADSDGLAEVVLHDRHLLGRALGAEQAATVATVVLSGGQTELVLEKKHGAIIVI